MPGRKAEKNPMAALLFVPSFGGAEGWRAAFAAAMPELDVRMWPDLGEARDIEIVALGQPPAGLFRKLPNLRLIISVIAGTDALLRAPELPDVPIVRAGSPDGDAMMNEAALLHVLRHHRHMPEYLRAQQRGEWLKLPIKAATERKVGVMGLGSIGLGIANALAAAGFKVAGWVRRPREANGIEVFAGRDSLAAFLARSEIVVNLLPLTLETRGIIGADTLKALPAGAAVINLGRGEHVIEADLIAALDSGHLGAATLDVFPVEPLPGDSPLWRHPKITVMPHVSRRLVAEDLAPRVCAIVKNFNAGRPLTQHVDRKLGY
jgi:glyoxylate/hydroxypyruvate reductase A